MVRPEMTVIGAPTVCPITVGCEPQLAGIAAFIDRLRWLIISFTSLKAAVSKAYNSSTLRAFR